MTSSSASAGDALAALLNSAETFRQSGQLDAALEQTARAVALYPNASDAQQAHTLLLVDLRRFEAALDGARALVALQQKSPQAHNILAYILLSLGQYEAAVQSYDRVLAINPKAADIHSDRAVALLQLKRYKDALKSIDKALMLQPKNAAFHNNRGNALKEMDQLAEALKSYDRAIAHAPNFVDAHSNRALVLNRLKRFDEALVSCEQALALGSNSAELHNNRGSALRGLEKLEEALKSYDQALAINPDFLGAHNNRGVTLIQLERYAEAEANLRRAIALGPDSGEAHGYLSLALHGLNRSEEALASYARAVALQPGNLLSLLETRSQLLLKMKRYADVVPGAQQILAAEPNHLQAHRLLASAYYHLGQYDTAMVHYNRAVEIDPKFAENYNDRGVGYVAMGQRDAAMADYERALALDPNYAACYWNKAIGHLLFGEYAEGFKLYEWRWKTPVCANAVRDFAQPFWLGETPIAGKTLLIYPEQGFGDYLQCARYIPRLEAMGAKLVLETYPAFLPLMRALSPTATLVVRGDTLPPFDVHTGIMSLPLAFGTTVENVPNAPYLAAEPMHQAIWNARLGPKTRPRIGLVWAGSTWHGNDHNRSLALATLAPLLQLPCEFHVLQKELRASDAPTLQQFPDMRTHMEELKDFGDTAALIAAMDLVISVDTSTLHLAGAVGKTTWLLLPYAPDYRWMLGRDDTPWYPSIRLFRQPQTGDWPSVIDRVIEGVKTSFLA